MKAYSEMITNRFLCLALSAVFWATGVSQANNLPNVVWIVIEDASPHIGCYGETAIKTPQIAQARQMIPKLRAQIMKRGK